MSCQYAPRTFLRVASTSYVRLYLSNTERTAALIPFLEQYNTNRPHTALGGLPPLTRICQ